MLQYIFFEHPFFAATGLLYGAATAAYAAAWRSTRAAVGRLGTAFLAVGVALNVWLVVGRWIEAGREPFKSLFESLVFLALCLGALYVVLERLYRTRVFGLPAAVMLFGCMAYALAKWDAEIVKLPPALQSPWFMPHVMVYFVGYAALAFAAGVAVVQLLASRFPSVRRLTAMRAGTMLTGQALDLDQITYDVVRFGFVLLTLGLLIGSVWAKSAWGDFWVWDPKENWSLVTWLIYGAYLHLRKVKGWRGDRAAWLQIVGFAVVMFTYLGMGMLPTAEDSAHVYTGQ
ncbi:MAG TPA: c-type cytochrome biogenesis protein CcsB [Anaeromyxobacteraceae bacterium]|nr:c-type cytochrome biogenesis protein CcsB [Anaeromyxobacteraceae bacterium]